MRNVAALAVFNTIYWRFVIVAYFLGHPVGRPILLSALVTAQIT